MPARRLVLLAAAAGVALIAAPPAAEAAGTWNAESYLASPLREADGPSIAVTTTGAAVAGWQAEEGSPSQVDAFLAARAPGTGPFAMGGTPQAVKSAKAHDEGDMGVVTAINPAGKAVVAWVQATFNGSFRVQAVVRAAGASAFGTVQTLTEDGEDASEPAVAINASGAAVLVWRRHETATESWQVQGAALSDAGTTFTPLNAGGNISDEPDDDFDNFASLPVSVAVAPSGAAVVAWDSTEESTAAMARWARRAPGAVAFGPVNDLGAATRNVDVAASDDGSFAMTWITGSGGTGADVSLARATTGDFGAPVEAATTPGSIAEARVGVDAAGNAIVALIGTTIADFGASPRVAVTTCTATCPEPDWLSADGQRAQGLDLAVNAAGDAVAAWSRSNGTRELIEASLLAHGASWDAPVFISRADQAAHAPTVGIDGGGNVTAAWTAANVALAAVRQATGAVAGATAPPDDPGPGDPGPGGPGPGDPGPPGGGGPGGPQPVADIAVAAAARQAAKITATSKGRFKGPKVTCSEPAGGSCNVVVSFTTPKGKKKLAVGRVVLTLPGGRTATPTISLRKAAKSRLRSKGKLALTGRVVITDAAGNKRTLTVKATLKAAKKKKRAG